MNSQELAALTGSALDPLPTEAAKRLILGGAYSPLSACCSSQSLDGFAAVPHVTAPTADRAVGAFVPQR
jgi:hypothetical protein